MGYPYYYQPQGYQQGYPQMSQQTQQQIQNNGFMVVPNEDVVKTYPVAPGSCVTFKIEGKPIVMEKSMGFSQFESPRIDKYRLIHEEDTVPQTQNHQIAEDESDNTFDEIHKEIDEIWKEIDLIKSRKTTKKKEVIENDSE